MTTRALVFCDRCHKNIAANYDEAHIDLIDRAEHEGWASIRRHGTYTNLCASCADGHNTKDTK